MSGERLFAAVRGLADEPGRLEQMGKNARRLARPGAAARAAAVLEEAAKAGGGRGRQWARETAERD
jgi:UDP-N-acetylglucosamine:LPS N-acetylglucosamine transferase